MPILLSAEIKDLRIDKIKFCSRIFQDYENRHYFTTIKNIFAKQNKAREERDFYYLEQQFDVEKGKKDLQELWQNIKNSNIKNIFAKKNKAKEDNNKKKRYKPFKLKVEFLELFSLLIFELISKKGTSLTRILCCFCVLGLCFANYHNIAKSDYRFAFSSLEHYATYFADGLKFILSPFSFPDHSQLKLPEALFYALRTMLWLIFSFMLHKRFRINS